MPMQDNATISITAKINESKSLAEMQKSLDSLEKKLNIKDLGNLTGMSEIWKKNSKGVKELTGYLATYKTEAGKVRKVTMDVNGAIKNVTTSMGKAKKETVGFGNEMAKNAVKFASWMGLTTIFFGVVNAIKQGVEQVRELDSALVELNRVANLTDKQLEEVTATAFELGNALGQTGKTVIEATSEFSRAGYDIAESMELARTAIILTNVSEVDMAQATDALISTMVNFNITAGDSISIADKLNQVSNNTASSVDVLANGLTRTAGVLSQTGVTLDENLGLLVAGFTSLRNIEKVSSGLITTTSRLQRMADPMDELNELTPKLEESLNDIGVELLDQEGNFRSLYDILQDLSYVYDDLNDKQRANINFLLAGTRQAPVITAVVRDFNLAEEAVNESLTSQNSALEENAIALESIDGKVNQLSSSWSKFWNTAISTEGVKLVVDLLRATVDSMTDVIDSTGELGDTLSDAAVSASPFFAGLINVISHFREGKIEIDDFSNSVNGVTQSVSELNTELEEINLNELIRQAIENGEDWNLVIDDYINGVIKASGTTEELASDTKSLSDALVELAEEGEISDETLLSMADNQQAVQFALTATEEDIIKLATVYGRTAEEIIDIQEFLTNELIRQTQLRMTSIATEILALEAEASAIMSSGDALTEGQQRELYGAGRGLSEALFEIEEYSNRLDDLNTISEKLSGSTKSSKESVQEFSDNSEEIWDLQIDLVNGYKDALEDALEKEIDLLEEAKELGSEARQAEIDALEEQKDLADELADIEDKKLEIQEAQLEVQKAQEELQKISEQRNTRLFTGDGWTWIADPEAVAEAEQAIVDAENEVSDLSSELADLEEDRLFNQTIANLESELEAFESMWDSKISSAETALEELKNMEQTTYEDMLSNLEDYVDSYNATYSTLGKVTSPDIVSSASISSPTSASSETEQEIQMYESLQQSQPEKADFYQKQIDILEGDTSGLSGSDSVVDTSMIQDSYVPDIPTLAPLSEPTDNSTSISISGISLPNVTDGNSFVNEITEIAKVNTK